MHDIKFYRNLITREDIRALPKRVINMSDGVGCKHALQVFLLILALSTLLVMHAAFGDTSSPTVELDGFERMKENQIKLYDALRYFAFPDLDYNSNVQQRFILQVPGKVLNPMDYYPGQKYEEFLSSSEQDKQVVNIPEQVMERMFHLSDIVPGAHPLSGRETGYSLARLYESILDNLGQIGFDDLSEDGKHLYKQALEKLVEPMPDPDDHTKQLPLFQLYTKFQEAYHTEQARMETIIIEKNIELSANDYRLWFERNYPILSEQVEAAYRRWLLYGQKHLAESYIASLDISSTEKVVQEARTTLRLSGFMPHNGSETVYPVTFSPSNWFKYLNTSQRSSLTRDQVKAKIVDLKSRIALLETMSQKSTIDIEEKIMYSVKQEREKKQNSLWQKVEELEDTRRKCWLAFDSVCDFLSKEEEVTDALSKSKAANFKVEMLEWQFGDNSSFKDQIEFVLMKLRNETEQLQKQLMNSVPSVSSLVDDMGTTGALLVEEIQDHWEYFEFSSTKDERSAATSLSSSNSVSIGNILPFSLKPSTFQGYQTFTDHVQGANLTLKAKVLKVKINRPWFRPSLFQNRELKLRKSGNPISPGFMNERDFYNEVTKESIDGPLYLLYQYPTAFLLAKEIVMDFTGLSDKAKQAALISSVGTLLKGSYGPISYGASISAAGSYNHMQVSSTVNGLTVHVPGAQIIGYYCDVIPKFPNTYNLTEFSSQLL